MSPAGGRSDEPRAPHGSAALDELARQVAADDELRRRLQRRTLAVVVASQVLGGAGLAAGVTVGALLAQEVLGSDGLAGIPTALFTLGSALAAFLVGRITQHRGRRLGLGLGFAAGGLGAAGVVIAAVVGNVPLLFLSLFVYGAGTATNLQARYAGADLATPRTRATAVSIAMVSTTLGAVAGPNLVEPLGRLAESWGIPALAGPFLLGGAAYVAAGAVLLALLRPDPFLLARRLPDPEAPPLVEASAPAEAAASAPAEAAAAAPAEASLPAPAAPRPGPAAYAGATVMVLTQIAMVAIMTMTPVHMRAHHHGLSEVGLVIGLHIAAMYLPSLVTGVLVDRIGRTPMAIAAGVTLLAAGIVAAVAPADSLGLLILALVLLGLGWNFGLISGTALVVDATVPANRARTQGGIDVLIALAGAGGGVMSGVVMAASSYATLALAGGVLSLVLIPVLFWASRAHRRTA
ncbi:MFS transporter [Agromyces mediolanus]|uniref:MFS transporter n=1 Tax=Agromyces mediolanus TaxID=41986 RepID=UPI00203ED63D|nr:MFS transporter [Agromyces mediolanus]MCM3658293.1 MFS transporter [Agromyces mediolanus]